MFALFGICGQSWVAKVFGNNGIRWYMYGIIVGSRVSGNISLTTLLVVSYANVMSQNGPECMFC